MASAREIQQDTELLARRGSRTTLQPMNAGEQSRVANYVDAWQRLPSGSRCDWEDLVVHVGDNPKTGWTTWTAHSQSLPTIRRTGSLYYAPAWQRHLTLAEMFLGMGCPTHALSLQWSNLPESRMIDLYSEGSTLSWFDWRRALGNSMHVAAVGAFAGTMLACSRMRCHDFTYEEIASFMDTA